MNDEIIIKNALTVEEYNYLREDVNWNKKNPDFIKMAIENSTIVKKAMLNDTIVGMARAIGDGKDYLLVDVVVSVKYQKKGIGKKLVESIISEIKIKVPKGEYATLNLISIAGMEKFYESCGLKAVPFDYNGKGMRMEIK